MRKILGLILCLVSITTIANAGAVSLEKRLKFDATGEQIDWVFSGNSQTAEIWIDNKSVRTEGNLKKAWILLNLNQPQQFQQKRVLSRYTLAHFDCRQQTLRFVMTLAFPQPWTQGWVAVATEELNRPFVKAPRGSFAEDALRYICRFPDGGINREQARTIFGSR